MLKKGLISLTVTASVLLPLGTTVNVFADSTSTSLLGHFNTIYQDNLSIENGLLATAQSGQSTSAKVAALEQTVTLLNQNSASMFTTLQALVNNRANLASVLKTQNSSGTTVAQKNIENELKKIDSELSTINRGKQREKENKQHKQLIKDRTDLERSLRLIKVKIPEVDTNQWQNHPYDGSIPTLEKAILSMQKSAIYYTKLWIGANQQGQTTTTATSTTTTTSSVYGN